MTEHGASLSLQEALARIGDIRAKMTEATLFRGYRAVPVATTGVLAIFAALAQAAWIPEPGQRAFEYVILWAGLAGLCLVLVTVQLTWRYRTSESALARRSILRAVEAFAPCVLAGGLTTVMVLRFALVAAPLLPGLWATFFSLGIFSSARRLPPACWLIGAFYLMAGTALLALAGDGRSLSPFGMGITFGVGQLATATMLYFTLERNRAPSE